MGSAKKNARKQRTSDHHKWELILKGLKQILCKQANQLHSLLLERNRSNSHVCLLLDVISQKQRQLWLSELRQVFESTKADLLLGSNQRDALLTKLKLEHAWSELDDFKAWFDILSHKCPDNEDISPDRLYESLKAKVGRHSTSKKPDKHHSELEKQVAGLKEEYEKLSVKHKSDITALQDENKFVWNQYKDLEDQLKTKNDVIDRVNENMTNLLKRMEQLQSASLEKDETVATLRTNNTKLEDELNAKDQDISRLTKEIELLRSKHSDGVPLSSNCSPELIASDFKGRRCSRRKGSVILDEDATTLRAKVSELESERNQKSEEISTLSRELKLLRSQISADTPVLKRCINEPSSSRSIGIGNCRKIGTAAVEEKASFLQPEATIASLKVKISELEALANQKDGEISALSKELKLLKSSSAADTPVLRQCTSRPSSSRSRGRKDGRNRNSATSKKETSSQLVVSEQGGKRSKRKRNDAISIKDTPKLFTSDFKLPRLRSQSQSPHD